MDESQQVRSEATAGSNREPKLEIRTALTERQASVLRTVVAGYVGGAAPMSSAVVSQLLPVKLSPASVRSTMAQLAELGLVEKSHCSSGRVPTEAGLRVFVDQLLRNADVDSYLKSSLTRSFERVEVNGVVEMASRLLSSHTRQLGFVLAPRLERMVLRHVSLVRISSERLLVVLVSAAGRAHQRIVEDPGTGDQLELDRVAQLLNERAAGRSLAEVRSLLHHDLSRLRDEASRRLRRALALGLRALAPSAEDAADLVIASRLALLDQPEFQDPERIRELYEAIETGETLVEVLDSLLEGSVRVAIGDELDETGLHRCAVILAPYGGDEAPLGALGVIGPSRMDYARIIPFVSCCSQLVTQKLSA